jgi:hypothetical protein
MKIDGFNQMKATENISINIFDSSTITNGGIKLFNNQSHCGW